MRKLAQIVAFNNCRYFSYSYLRPLKCPLVARPELGPRGSDPLATLPALHPCLLAAPTQLLLLLRAQGHSPLQRPGRRCVVGHPEHAFHLFSGRGPLSRTRSWTRGFQSPSSPLMSRAEDTHSCSRVSDALDPSANDVEAYFTYSRLSLKPRAKKVTPARVIELSPLKTGPLGSRGCYLPGTWTRLGFPAWSETLLPGPPTLTRAPTRVTVWSPRSDRLPAISGSLSLGQKQMCSS